MKRVQIDHVDENLILTGLILSDEFIKEVQPILHLEYFRSTSAKRIASWCQEFFETSGKAPAEHIQDIYQQKVEEEALEDSDLESIERILTKMSKEAERRQLNFQYLMDRAESYFQKQDYKNLAAQLSVLSTESTREARDLIENHKHVELPTSLSVNPLTDRAVIRRSLEEARKPILKLPGAMGRLLGQDLQRESFVAFMGREKIGKTYILMEMAWRAIQSRLNTVFVQCGDMTEAQQIRRIGTKLTARPYKQAHAGKQLIPVYDCIHNQTGECDIGRRPTTIDLEVKNKEDMDELLYNKAQVRKLWEEKTEEGYEPCTYCRLDEKLHWNYKGSPWWEEQMLYPYTFEDYLRAGRNFSKRLHGRQLRMLSYPNDTVSPNSLMSDIDRLINYEGFVPDVIIPDYADIMVSDNDRDDFRHRTNQIWKGLRKISQVYHALVITATQADAASYKKKLLDLSNYSEDKRKFSHVTSMIGINQMGYEKAQGKIRYNMLLTREDDFEMASVITALQSPATGKSLIGSYV